MSDEPLEPCDLGKPFIADVIDLEGVRIAWGRNTKPAGQRCKHRNMVYSSDEKRVWCQDCQRTIENWDAFMVLVENFRSMERTARAKLAEADEAMKATARLRATKALDKVWSGNVMAVACPHCRGGLLPEDFVNGGSAAWARDLELARRRKANEPKL